MKTGYAVIWKAKTLTVFKTEAGDWSLDAGDARVFTSWFAARFQAALAYGARVAQAWT